MGQGKKIIEQSIIDKWSFLLHFRNHPNKNIMAIGCEIMGKFLMEINDKENNIETLIFPVIITILSTYGKISDAEIGSEVLSIYNKFKKFLEVNYPFPDAETERQETFKFTEKYLSDFKTEVEKNKQVLLVGSFKLIDILHGIGVDKELTIELVTEIATNYPTYSNDQNKIDNLFASKLTPEQLDLLIIELNK